MKNQKGFSLTEITIFIIVIAGAIGWILNVIKVTALFDNPVDAMFVLRCVGILLAPLGAVLGYMP